MTALAPSPSRRRVLAAPLWHRFSTFGFVVVFTGLIWWTADQSLTVTRSFAVRLRFAKLPGAAVQLASTDEYTVTLSGTQRLLSAFEVQLRNRQDTLTCRLSEEDARPAERIERLAREFLANAEPVWGSGLSITDVSPAMVTFSVDRVVTTAMEVAPDFGALAIEAATVTPTTVQVTLAERELARHPRRLRPAVEKLIRDWQAERPDASEFTLAVPLALPAGAERIDPPNVTLTGRVVDLLESAQKGPIQILPAVPSSVQVKFVVEPADEGQFRADVVIRGQKEALAALNAEAIRAYVDVLTSDEGQAGQIITRRAVVVLPKGFDLVGDPPDVKFRLVPRDSPGRSAP